MSRAQYSALLLLLALLVGVSAWLQFGLLARPADVPPAADTAAVPDYTIDNLVSTGRDADGKQYRIIAEHLAHFAHAERALLRRPHIIQYATDGAPRHITADSGWLYDDRAVALLTGNVRVVEGAPGAQSVATANTLTVRLKEHLSR